MLTLRLMFLFKLKSFAFKFSPFNFFGSLSSGGGSISNFTNIGHLKGGIAF